MPGNSAVGVVGASVSAELPEAAASDQGQPSPGPAMLDLDRLETELADVEIAIACLSRVGSDLCATCGSARVEGTLRHRPALAACAATKFPAEIPLDL